MRYILRFSISTKRETKITYLEHQKNIVNASGWNEYIISITNPNEEDIQKTIFLEGTRRDITGTLRNVGYVIRTSMVKQLRPWRI